MGNGPYIGKDANVKIGTTAVRLMGAWQGNGVSTEKFDASSFGDNWKTFLYGQKEGGTVTFNGHADVGDVTGQQVLLAANVKNSSIATIKFYLDNTSYFEPNQTTGYFGPGALSTGMGTPGLCSVNITAWSVSADKSGIIPISFTADINGCLALV